jgi:hypothetical protein
MNRYWDAAIDVALDLILPPRRPIKPAASGSERAMRMGKAGHALIRRGRWLILRGELLVIEAERVEARRRRRR